MDLKYLLETLHPHSVCCIFYHVNKDFYNASLSWREQKGTTLIMCAIGNWIFQKTTVKDGGLRLHFEVTVVICVVSASRRREELNIKCAWQINHAVLLTQPPSLSEVSMYFVHKLFICRFSMNYADSEYFRTNRGFHDILCTCINIL